MSRTLMWMSKQARGRALWMSNTLLWMSKQTRGMKRELWMSSTLLLDEQASKGYEEGIVNETSKVDESNKMDE